jgi:hypothetical protein
LKATCIVLLLALVAIWIGRPLRAGDAIKVTHHDINSEADDDEPFVTADGLTLFFSTNRGGTFDIYLARRGSAGQLFKAGKPFLASADDDERSPFFYKGQDLYFSVNHIPDEKLKGLRNFDIVKKTGERAPIPVIGISEKEDELHVWITPAGKEFYFSRKAKDGLVLMVAKGPTPGPIGEAKEVGFPPGFCRATLSSTATVMYLQGPLENGRTGIYRTRRATVSASWAKPEPVEALNHPEGKRGDMAPCLSGERLFFASDRPGGKGGLDICSVLLAQLK